MEAVLNQGPKRAVYKSVRANLQKGSQHQDCYWIPILIVFRYASVSRQISGSTELGKDLDGEQKQQTVQDMASTQAPRSRICSLKKTWIVRSCTAESGIEK